MWSKTWGLWLCLAVAGCGSADRAPPVTFANESDGTAEPVVDPAPQAAPVDVMTSTHWPDARLEGGTARITCSFDYEADGEGEPLESLTFFALVDALSPCRETGRVRVRYEGKIGAGFTALVQRVAAMADRMEIQSRVLDISSTGGHVEEAIRAGDVMADTRWDIWVREDAICHSACVLVLAGGDTRSVKGKVGIHRLFRDRSRANSRAELRAELKQVHGDVTEYLERNGGAAALADLMMTVPNRDLRLLTSEELTLFGLAGVNAAQADLDRILVMRRCGKPFVQRRDAFAYAFENQCLKDPGDGFEEQRMCGLALRKQFGFPDATCPNDGPLADLMEPDGDLRLARKDDEKRDAPPPSATTSGSTVRSR
ncbi:hypothetical protein [Cognatilysobacter bugurensis]|uniref:Uncharacterized protein n=1 Tax=Cognatilysobacter bugurensis TaxID=543356 RepID=A0A918W8V9_9GAMM|nr:hypothetical protein [Lysobacter bugurensis]GHA82478.1 hypothetical protein GCM10007067_20560 [Lysobacter bugurensis]